jgi:hypothetical protein
MFCKSLFVLFLLAIVFSVLLQFMASDYPFGIFKLFFHKINKIVLICIDIFILQQLYRITFKVTFLQEGVTVINNEGYKHGRDLHELNPDHTHFILVETESGDRERNQYIDFRSNIEKQ